MKKVLIYDYKAVLQLVQFILAYSVLKKKYIQVLSMFIFCLSCEQRKSTTEERFRIDFELVDSIKSMESGTVLRDRSASFISDTLQLNFALNDQSDVYYKFRSEVEKTKFKLDSFDYILSAGRALKVLECCKNCPRKKDACSDTTRFPVFKFYKTEINDSVLYIFKIRAKNRYRNPCG